MNKIKGNQWDRQLHVALEQAGKDILSTVKEISGFVGQAARRISGGGQAVELFFNNLTVQESIGPAFASLSMVNRVRKSAETRTNLMYELAASPAEIKARLAGVPVYAVVNSKKEFILVSGDDDSGRQLSLLFFNKADAEGFQETIKKENPKLGKSAQVLSTSLEAVYEFTTIPPEQTGTQGVSFRFMPDGRQVAEALEIYKKAGISREGFVGVPLFQAEGLTVKGESSRYTPLFFSKDDLDIALRDTFVGQHETTRTQLQEKINRASKELEDLETSADSKEKTGRHALALENSIQEAKKKLDGYKKRQREESQKKADRKSVV